MPLPAVGGAAELARVDVRLTRAAALLWCAATAVEFDPERPHPSLAYHVAMEAVRYPDLFHRLRIADGDRAVAGEIAIDLHRPVRLEHDYTVRATLDSIEHKHGATAGPFEKVTVRASAFGAAGAGDPDFAVTAAILVTRGPRS